MDHLFFEQLSDVCALIQRVPSLEDGLQELACLTARSLAVQRCSVMLLIEDEEGRKLRVCSHCGDLPAEAYGEAVPLDRGIAGHVAATGEALLIDDITRSPFAGLACRAQGVPPSLMSAPIKVADLIIGVINVSEPNGPGRFTDRELNLLKVFSLFVGKSIQVFQLQRLAESRVLQMAHVLDQRDRGGAGQGSICPDPARLAKMVAKGFYRELAGAGFGPSAIIAVASEVLSELNGNLGRHRARLERLQGPSGPGNPRAS